jgi:hypothetical protein
VAGLSVVTNYGTTKASYRLEKIDFQMSPMGTFEKNKQGSKDETEEITFMQYFKDRYGVTIRD